MKGIYLILNTATGKYYVGETVNLNRRRIGHFSELRRNIHRMIIFKKVLINTEKNLLFSL
ncbi:GIY-YIG nuclease family protein [Planococcus koreensis]|uniref:GIY-YIG nuclease family protein n=1 Tax=Planococcus koreensis TaxID=112331 RepID=UPI0010804DF0